RRDDRSAATRHLTATLALGAVFLAVQAFEFSRNGFGIGDGVFGSTFYTLTGFHGAHVSAGLLAIAALLRRSSRGLLGSANDAAAEAVSYYWHFVDVVWLVLFTTVYVL
ncbi:MAG: cytochrome c oxidase subunit 3, partial [Chloroflexota bacterium]